MDIVNVVIIFALVILVPASCSIIAMWKDNVGNGVKFSITVSLVIAIFSLISVVFQVSYVLDNIGIITIITSIISIPTAVVVGWNIYQIIDIKETKKKIDKWKETFAEQIKSDMQKELSLIGHTIKAEIYLSKISPTNATSDPCGFIYNIVMCIEEAQCGSYNEVTIDSCMDLLYISIGDLALIAKEDNKQMSKGEKDYCLRILRKVNDNNRFKEYVIKTILEWGSMGKQSN